MDAKADTLVKAYVNIRDAISAKKKEYDTWEKDMKGKLGLIELELRKICEETGAESLKTAYGTAYKVMKDFVAVKDWEQTINFIFENDMPQLLNKAVNKTAVKEYMAANDNVVPPGVEYGQSLEIQVRKS
jgi:hypothetical protein